MRTAPRLAQLTTIYVLPFAVAVVFVLPSAWMVSVSLKPARSSCDFGPGFYRTRETLGIRQAEDERTLLLRRPTCDAHLTAVDDTDDQTIVGRIAPRSIPEPPTNR
jgi:ABC-type glycerol-3-phosphate transport system permease component